MPFRSRCLVAMLCALVVIAAPASAFAGARLALVIGNSQYQSVPALDNPANDAADLAQALRGVGFEVIEERDATREAMAKAVRDFSEKLRGADVALLFYAGHGLQMNGENYLLPVDARIESAADVRFNTINLNDIQQEMEGTGRANIIILDACRNNPFIEKLARGGRALATRGLGRVEATGEGSLIVFSTQPDNVALDGAGRNSPFTAALLKHVATPGLEVRQMISRVRGDVLQATERKQTPWDSSSLVGDVYLAGPPQAAPAAPSAPAAAAANEAPKPVAAPAPAAPQPATPRAATAQSECDRLAAPPVPLAIPAAVASARPPTDWPHAVAVCAAEVEANPHEPRLRYQLGRAYYQLKNYPEAVRHYRIAADAGYGHALSDLGLAYVQGLGVVRNERTAFELFNKAALAGDASGMQNIGSMYGNGFFVKRDQSKALEWYEKSIEAGNAGALGAAGVVYFNGDGGPPDYKVAAQYFQQAADLGDGYSLKFLAIMYERGLLGPVDLEKAGALRAKAQEVDPQSQDPVVPPPQRTSAPSRFRRGRRPGRRRRRRRNPGRRGRRRRRRKGLRQFAVLHRNRSRRPALARHRHPPAALLAVLHRAMTRGGREPSMGSPRANRPAAGDFDAAGPVRGGRRINYVAKAFLHRPLARCAR